MTASSRPLAPKDIDSMPRMVWLGGSSVHGGTQDITRREGGPRAGR